MQIDRNDLVVFTEYSVDTDCVLSLDNEEAGWTSAVHVLR
jgi:hypothetical protein